MSTLSAVCFVIALLILFSCFSKKANIFSPARVFGFTWAFAVGLTELKFSFLQHQWQSFAWIVLSLAVFSFLIGVFVVWVLTISRVRPSPFEIRSAIQSRGINPIVLFRVILALFILYAVSYLIEWMYYGTLPLFATFPDKARSEFPMFGLHMFVGMMPIILFLVVEYFLLAEGNTRSKLVLSALFMTTAITSFLLLNRLYYLLFLALVIVFAYFSSRTLRLRNVFVVVAFFLAAFIFIQFFREVRYARNFIYVVSGMKYSESYAIFSGPYMYVVMNLENFARAVVRLENYSFGYFTFDFMMAVSGLKHWLGEYFGLNERVFLVSGYNTFPFFWDYYIDFGLMGVAFLSFGLGSAIALVYAWVQKHPSIVSISVYAVAVFVMIISFFTNALTSLNFVFNVAVLVVTQALVKPKTHQ